MNIDNINDLPVEILSKIFLLLDNPLDWKTVQLVCKLWYIWGPSVKKQIEKFTCRSILFKTDLKMLQRNANNGSILYRDTRKMPIYIKTTRFILVVTYPLAENRLEKLLVIPTHNKQYNRKDLRIVVAQKLVNHRLGKTCFTSLSYEKWDKLKKDLKQCRKSYLTTSKGISYDIMALSISELEAMNFSVC